MTEEKKNPRDYTRAEELELLRQLSEKIRLDPAYGFQLLQKAGIYDENGELTEKYRDR